MPRTQDEALAHAASVAATREAMVLLRAETADATRIRRFWRKVLLSFIVFVLSVLFYVYSNLIVLKRELPDVFEWMSDAIANADSDYKILYRSITDVSLAAMNPTMHSALETFAVYKDCPQSAAEFAIMTIRFFKKKLTLAHWAGTLNGGYSLQQWFPVMDPKTGHEAQWAAWSASKDKNIWYDLFPQDQTSFFLVPVIHEFSHESDHTDLRLTRLGVLFTDGLSGVISNLDYTKSPATLFHDFWVSDNPPKAPSCSGQVARALISGGSVGMNLGMSAKGCMPGGEAAGGEGGGPGTAVAAGVAVLGMAVGTFTSLKSQKEQCAAERQEAEQNM